MKPKSLRTGMRAALLLSLLLGVCACMGCQSSGPGLENKPPPQGGPPANSASPPGEVRADDSKKSGAH